MEQRTIVIVQRLGKFREAGPGLHAKVPLIDRVIGRMKLRVQQLDVKIETKTEDNAFAHMLSPRSTSSYRRRSTTRSTSSMMRPGRSRPRLRCRAGRVPKINLDDVFEKKDEIADIVFAFCRGENV